MAEEQFLAMLRLEEEQRRKLEELPDELMRGSEAQPGQDFWRKPRTTSNM